MRKILCLILIMMIAACCGCKKSGNTASSDISNTKSVASSSTVEEVSSAASSDTGDETSSAGSVSSEVGSKATESAASSKSSSSSKSQAVSSTTSKKQNSASAASSEPFMGHGQGDIQPIPESLNWTSLAGEWKFKTSDKSRTQAADFLIIYFNINSNDGNEISYWGYSPIEEADFDVSPDIIREIDGKKYFLYWGAENYYGNFFITVGEEDKPVLELRCYDATGNNFLSDELHFKRLDNDTLQYIGDDFSELELCTGDIFKR